MVFTNALTFSYILLIVAVTLSIGNMMLYCKVYSFTAFYFSIWCDLALCVGLVDNMVILPIFFHYFQRLLHKRIIHLCFQQQFHTLPSKSLYLIPVNYVITFERFDKCDWDEEYILLKGHVLVQVSKFSYS